MAVELLCRLTDGDVVLSGLQEQPSLGAPALELASRLMASKQAKVRSDATKRRAPQVRTTEL